MLLFYISWLTLKKIQLQNYKNYTACPKVFWRNLFAWTIYCLHAKYYYWLIHLLVPLIVGWSAICCVTGLMAFLHLDLSLARLTFRCFLYRSVLPTSFHFNFDLPQDFGLSTLKLMILFVHDFSSCLYKWPNSLSLFHLKTLSIWWTWTLLLRSSVECFCSIWTLLNQRIIACSHLLICGKSSVDRGKVSLSHRRTLLTQALNTFPWFTRDTPLIECIGRSSWKAFQADPIQAVTASVQPPDCPVTSPR